MNAAVLGWAERRRFVRVPLSDWLGEVTLAPRGHEGSAVDVLDFSPCGVSLAATAPPAWVAADAPLVLRLLAWEIPCKLGPGTADSDLDFHRTLHAGRVGLALSFDRQGQEQVARLYHLLRFPSLHRRRAFEPADVQQLFSDSGYLALRPGLEPDATWTGAAWPSSLSHEAVFRATDGRPIGHIAITRAYRNAWLGHEIATLSDAVDKSRCRRDLYQHFSLWPRLQDGESTHVFGYYNPKRRFHQQMFEGFASRSSTDDCVVVRMERYMPQAQLCAAPSDSMGGSGVADGDLVVDPMQEADEPAVLRLLARYLPTLALAAFDLGPGCLSQAVLHPSFAALGLERGRQCLVVRAGADIVAVLLCEWDGTRLSLFDVLSLAHLFLSPDIEPTPQFEAVISGALRSFYRNRGARLPLLTCPPGTFHRRDLPGFRWTETMACIVFSAHALRAFETYVDLSLDSQPRRTDQGRTSSLEK